MKNRYAAWLLALAAVLAAAVLLYGVFQANRVIPHTPAGYTVQTR